MRDCLPKTRVLLIAAMAILTVGCGGGGGGIFSGDPGDLFSVTHANPSTTRGVVTGIAVAQIDVENERSTQRTMSLALSGSDAHYFLTDPENDENATPNPATIVFSGSETRTVYVAILCVRPDDPRPVTLRVSDSVGSHEVTIDDYRCDPPDIQFSTEQDIAGASDQDPTIISPDHSSRYAYRNFPITTDLPRPPPDAFNLDNPDTVNIEVTVEAEATPGSTVTQQITVWRAPHDPEAAEQSTTPRTTLTIPFRRQDAQRAVVHWSCPEAPGEHTLRGTVRARLVSSRFEWESDQFPYHQVCVPPRPPTIELLPPGEPLRARLSEWAEGQFRIVNPSPIPREFTVEITPSNAAPFQVDVAGNRNSRPVAFGATCDLDDLSPTIAIEVDDAFTRGTADAPRARVRTQCAGLPLAVFPRTLNLRTPPIAPTLARGVPVIAAQQFSVINRAQPIPGGGTPQFTMSFNDGECDPKGGPCVWTQNEWNAICPRLPCTTDAFDARTPTPEHGIPAGQVTRMVLTAPCDEQTTQPSHSVPIETRLDGEPVPAGQDLPPLQASVSCEGQATGPEDIRIDGPDRIDAKGWEYAEGFIHIANESRGAITPTVNISGLGEFLDGRTTTRLPTIQPQGTHTLDYRAACPDSHPDPEGADPTVYPITLSLQDPAKDYEVTLTCAPADVSVALPLPRLNYEQAIEIPEIPDERNPGKIRIDKSSLRLDAYVWGQFQVAAHLDSSKLIPQPGVEGVRWDWNQIQSASDFIITDQAGWTEWRNAAHEHRVTVSDFLKSVEELPGPHVGEVPVCDPRFPLRPTEEFCVPTRPDPPRALESVTTADFGQRTLYIYWACPDPNEVGEELAQEEGEFTIHASKGSLRSRPFSQTIGKACETALPLDPVNQFLVHQGLVVQHDHAPGPIEPLRSLEPTRSLSRYLSFEIYHPSEWDLNNGTPRLSVTQTVGEEDASQRPSPPPEPVELVLEVPIATDGLMDAQVSKSVAIYKIQEPEENRDLIIRIRFHDLRAPPDSESGRYDTDQVFRIPSPRIVERLHRPIHVLWGRSDGTTENDRTFLSDLARRVPLIHAEGSTFNGTPGTTNTAHGLLTDFANQAGHPADWVFVPVSPGSIGPDEWPLGAHEGVNNTAGVHYARVARVPDPRVTSRRMAAWLNYANDLDAWSYAAARWLDAGDPTYPAVTWLNLISQTSTTDPFRIEDFFRPNDAHDINDRSTDAATNTAASMGVPSVPTWERMMAHLDREPARSSRGSQGNPLSHILIASRTASNAEAGTAPQLSLTRSTVLSDWGASPRRSGGNRHWRVVYFTAAANPSGGNTFNFACEAGSNLQPSGITAAARAAYPGIRRQQIDVPLTTFNGSLNEHKGIAWRLPGPDNAGACGDGAQCNIRQLHIQTDPNDSRSWHCFQDPS